MGKFNFRRGLAAAFSAMALATGAIPAQPLPASRDAIATTPQEPMAVVQSLFNAGHRGMVMGDLHTDLALPLWLAANMQTLKAMGVTTLYVEVPLDRQPLLEAMKQGDLDAKQQLVQSIDERTPGMAQARVEMMAAAQKAGLRVIGIDLSTADVIKLQEAYPKGGDYIADRMLWADPVLYKNLQAQDDGQKYLVFIGAAHTYPANVLAEASRYSKGVNNAVGCLEPDNFFETSRITPEGGIDTRLGIPSIDSGNCPSQIYTGAPTIRRSHGNANDFIITLPSHPLQGIGYPAADYGNWRTILARDMGSLYHATYSGPPVAVPAAEAALAIYDFRAALVTNPDAQKLRAAGEKLESRLQALEAVGDDTITPTHIGVLRNHYRQMSHVSLDLQPKGLIAERLSTYADSATVVVGMGARQRPPTEAQVELTRSQIAAQLDSLRERRLASPRLSAAPRAP